MTSVPALLRLAAPLEAAAGTLGDLDPEPREAAAYCDAGHLLANLDCESVELARDLLAVPHGHRRRSQRRCQHPAGPVP